MMAAMTGTGTATLRILMVVLAAACASAAAAHTGSVAGGFVGGLAHPVFGLDHVVAMVAVGLWGAFLGAPAIVVLPIVFPLVMAAGAQAAASTTITTRSVPVAVLGTVLFIAAIIKDTEHRDKPGLTVATLSATTSRKRPLGNS